MKEKLEMFSINAKENKQKKEREMTCLQTKEWKDSQLLWYFTKAIRTETIIEDIIKEKLSQTGRNHRHSNELIIFQAKFPERDQYQET